MAAPTKPIQDPYLPKPIGGGEHSNGPGSGTPARDDHVDTARQSSGAKPPTVATKDEDRLETWLYDPAPADNRRLQDPNAKQLP